MWHEHDLAIGIIRLGGWRFQWMRLGSEPKVAKNDGRDNGNDGDGLGDNLVSKVNGVLGENFGTDESAGMIAMTCRKLF